MTKRPARERQDVGRSIRERVGRLDVEGLARDLGALGHARLPRLLTAAECREVRATWERPEAFRKRVNLARHGFGDHGEYQYFARPLPPLVDALRTHLYPPLAAVANAWAERLGDPRRFPARLSGLRRLCREHGQHEPTPLVLDYEAGGYNCLHQDLYGTVAFPLQVAIGLSRPGRDYEGGAFLLVEQRPRQQSRGDAIELALGEAVVFPTRERPVEGARGPYRANVRHGVARIARGHRMTLGIIFHDAES
ncbi:MAG TPA: 2OG-Fe(II) oxygenase [Myxococcota bacterium]|nr:2OG-Fe(II) oxygenase [Myxococcota bacterium]